MELKVIDYTRLKNYNGLSIGFTFIAFWALFIIISTDNTPIYYSLPLLTIMYCAMFFIMLYRPYQTVGKLTLGKETVTVEADGEVKEIPVGDLQRIFMRYTNCRKPLGKFTNNIENYIDLVTTGGHEKRLNIVIEGKKAKEQLKSILQEYKEREIPVMVQSVVNATWQEF